MRSSPAGVRSGHEAAAKIRRSCDGDPPARGLCSGVERRSCSAVRRGGRAGPVTDARREALPRARQAGGARRPPSSVAGAATAERLRAEGSAEETCRRGVRCVLPVRGTWSLESGPSTRRLPYGRHTDRRGSLDDPRTDSIHDRDTIPGIRRADAGEEDGHRYPDGLVHLVPLRCSGRSPMSPRLPSSDATLAGRGRHAYMWILATVAISWRSTGPATQKRNPVSAHTAPGQRTAPGSRTSSRRSAACLTS